jgi:hypothetical protein
VLYVPQARLPNNIPTATGRDPWGSLLRNTAQQQPAANLEYLAFGAGNITQDPRYLAANLPPYNDFQPDSAH